MRTKHYKRLCQRENVNTLMEQPVNHSICAVQRCVVFNMMVKVGAEVFMVTEWAGFWTKDWSGQESI